MSEASPADWSSGPDRAARLAWLGMVSEHVPLIGRTELEDAYFDEINAVQAAEEDLPWPATSVLLQERMLDVEARVRALASEEVVGLYLLRGELGMDAELTHGHAQLVLGLQLGAAIQRRATIEHFYRWQVGEPPDHLAARLPIDHRAAVANARLAADEQEASETIRRRLTEEWQRSREAQ